VRFLLDHDVDAAVGKMLRQSRHECWTAGQVGLAVAADDSLTIWATNHNAAVVSTDVEFGRRRMRNAIGLHVWLRCPDWEAREVLDGALEEVVARLATRTDLTIRVSRDGVADSGDWA
jgi:predicted nuclease of predicted toxin-antitoxin system